MGCKQLNHDFLLWLCVIALGIIIGFLLSALLLAFNKKIEPARPIEPINLKFQYMPSESYYIVEPGTVWEFPKPKILHVEIDGEIITFNLLETCDAEHNVVVADRKGERLELSCKTVRDANK